MRTIKQLREAAGLTQRELAARLDVTVTSVSGWERRACEPRASQLRRLAQLFGVSMDEIAFEAGIRPERPAGKQHHGRKIAA